MERWKIERNTESFGKWTREAAEATGAYFIDLNKISADKLEKKGVKKAATYYNHDHTHTSKKGAELNAKMLAKGLKEANCPLAKSIKLITYWSIWPIFSGNIKQTIPTDNNVYIQNFIIHGNH